MVLETVHAKREKKTTVIIRKREKKRERETTEERITEDKIDGKKIVLLLKT